MKETKENAIVTVDVEENGIVVEEKSKTTFWTKCKEFGDKHQNLKKAAKVVGLTVLGGIIGLGAGYIKGSQDAFDYSVAYDEDIVSDDDFTDDSTDSNES